MLNNRVGWATTYMVQAGLLKRPKRGHFRITDTGRRLLAERPQRIDVSMLERYPDFVDFRARNHGHNDADVETKYSRGDLSEETPDDELARARRRLRSELEQELLETVMQSSPEFFERLVIDLLVALGYGGNRGDAAKRVGRSGDEGIDGVIDEDPLGLDIVYVQAKRWAGTVGRPEVQKFAGALQGQRAKKGVMITTSRYTNEAHEYASNVGPKIVLIDGHRLSSLMVDHDVGVSLSGSYPVKRIDSDYFSED